MGIKDCIKIILPDSLCKIGKSFLRSVKYKIIKIESNKNLRSITKIKPYSNIIKVGFIVQMPEIWDKEAPVFEAMMSDDRFDPYLIVIPAYDIKHSRIGDYSNELQYFRGNYAERTIIAYDSKEWFDLEQEQFDCVFYQRCYEIYLPQCYHTRMVIKYAKTCYVPYGIAGLDQDISYYQTSFFCNLFYFFCTSKEQEQMLSRHFRCGVYCGSPALEALYKKILSESSNRNQVTNILWTPRWTDDEYYGKSTFFNYKDKILSLKKVFPALRVVLRPHPMTFDNAVRINRMTEKEVDDYKNKVIMSGLSFDENAKIEDTFLNTDILITDYSSMIIQYFMTGRPVIYCSNPCVNFDSIYKELLSTFYIAANWEDVIEYLKELTAGIDSKKESRLKLLEKIMIENQNSTRRILDTLANG